MLLLGGVLALLAFFVLYIGLSAAGNNKSSDVSTTPTVEPKAQVVVAATDIPAFTVLKEDMLTIKEVDLSTIMTGTTATTVDLIGRMVTRDYQQDAQLRLDDVTDPGISQILTKGQRAFVMPVQEINNFGGQLVDGDTLDMLWTREFKTTATITGPDGAPLQQEATLGTTKTILQGLKILRVISLRSGGATGKSSSSAVNTDASLNSGTTNDPATEQAKNDATLQTLYNDQANGKDEPVYTAVAVMAVTDQQAEVIKYAREYGKISLALRAKDDTDEEKTTGITDKILVQDYGLVLPEVVVK